MTRIFSTIFISLFILTSSCILAGSGDKLNFNYKIFHTSETSTDFYIKIDLNTYLSKIINNSKYVKIGVTLSLTNVVTNVNYKSSREFNLDINAYPNSIYTDSFSIKMEPADYEMEILIKDVNLNQSREEYREFSKNYLCISENFLFFNSDSSLVYYKENPASEEITVQSQMIQCDSLEIRTYSLIQTIALPPFSSKKIYPDFESYESIFFNNCENKNFKLKNIKNKTLFISSYNSSNPDEGFLFSKYANFYPKVKTVYLLVEPLRYISSRDEYSELNDATKQRRKIFEKFWIDKADGDREQARYLIREYYTRVEFANKYFSTYKEGWKTDRGMVLIVFGEPESIENEGRKEERWIYSNRGASSSISFSFYREEGSFLKNDYTLVRNLMFKAQWYDAVDSWRNGMPYHK